MAVGGGSYGGGYYYQYPLTSNTTATTTWTSNNTTYIPMPVQQPYMISVAPQVVALPQPDLRDDHVAWLRGRVDEIRDLVRAA